MGLEQEFVFRCDICKRRVERDEYAYPWYGKDSGVFSFLCKGCDFVTSKLLKAGWLIGWDKVPGEQPIHTAIDRGGVNEAYGGPSRFRTDG